MKRRAFIQTLLSSAAAPVVFGGFVQCSKSEKNPAAKSVLKDGQTLLFIGDSITQDATYVNFIETFLLAKHPDRHFNVVGLGLSSETVCGLTEPVHPYPRPNVHDRLDRILERTQPDVVMTCYGMNDGIYAPLSEDRFAAYKAGIEKVIEKVRAAGAQHQYVITPPPYDPVPVKDKTVGEDALQFGYQTPYENYDDVLNHYGEWIMTLSAPDITPVDIHTPMLEHLRKNRQQDPNYYLARDGVHPGPAGHWIMAETILKAWNEFPVTEMTKVRIQDKKISGSVKNVSFPGGDVQFDWTLKVPVFLKVPGVEKLSALDDKLIRPVLQVSQSGVAGYAVYHDKHLLGKYSREDLEKGLDLSDIPAFDISYRGAKLLNLVRQRRQLYDGALRADIGHTLPNKGKPLTMEEAEKDKPALDKQVEQLSRPGVVNMRLVPYI